MAAINIIKQDLQVKFVGVVRRKRVQIPSCNHPKKNKEKKIYLKTTKGDFYKKREVGCSSNVEYKKLIQTLNCFFAKHTVRLNT